MRISIISVSVSLLCVGCATDPSPDVISAPRRELSQSEKSIISKSVISSLKDPEAARFKWLPLVVHSRDGVTDYCGLLNGKNSYGGYTGYMPFYVQLILDKEGNVVSSELRAMQKNHDDISRDVARGVCGRFGYADFSAAQ
jgi:hypothetical protein